jgi:hypothetical protein
MGSDLEEEHRNVSLRDDKENCKVNRVFNTFGLRGDLEVFGGRK